MSNTKPERNGVMFGFAPAFIAAQIVSVFCYVIIAMTFFLKSQKQILLLGIVGCALKGVSYLLLNAWTGFYMLAVAIIRNLVCYRSKKEKNNCKDVLFLVLILMVIIFLAIQSYDGFHSLFSLFSMIILTYSLWQKNPRIYKLLNIPAGISWALYNAYVGLIFGIIAETLLAVIALFGFIKDRKMQRGSLDNNTN